MRWALWWRTALAARRVRRRFRGAAARRARRRPCGLELVGVVGLGLTGELNLKHNNNNNNNKYEEKKMKGAENENQQNRIKWLDGPR